jgi:hypothetical protein
MATTDTSTIRVPTETRDRLSALAARRGEPPGEVVAKLVAAADEEAMLDEVATGFEKLAGDPEALSAYRAERDDSESSFDRSGPRLVDRSRALRDRLGRPAGPDEPWSLARCAAYAHRFR